MTETVADSLAAFLAARLDELEACASRAASDPVGAMEEHFMIEALREEQDWKTFPCRDTPYSHGQADAMRWASKAIRERMIPLSLHDPHRTLREVAAMRAILTYEARNGIPGLNAWGVWTDMLKHLAAAWNDHPHYRPEWKLGDETP